MGEQQTSEHLARRFHEAYERLAPSFGYETRQETREFDPASRNGRLMIAVCAEILRAEAQSSKTVTVMTAAKITELTTKHPGLGVDTFVHERDFDQAQHEIERLQQRVKELENECNRWADQSNTRDDEVARLRRAWDGIFGERSPENAANWVAELLMNQRPAVETAATPQAPIAKVIVRDDDTVTASLYAPGLPPGAHDLYCEPEANAPYMRKPSDAAAAQEMRECMEQGYGIAIEMVDALRIVRLMRRKSGEAPATPQLPIAKVTVHNDDTVTATLYAPWLPPGEHDLYCEPESVAPYLRAEKTSPYLNDGCPAFYQPEPKCSQCGKPEPWVFANGCPEKCGRTAQKSPEMQPLSPMAYTAGACGVAECKATDWHSHIENLGPAKTAPTLQGFVCKCGAAILYGRKHLNCPAEKSPPAQYDASKLFVLLCPDGRRYEADSALKCIGQEHKDRIPPEIRNARLEKAIEEAHADTRREMLEFLGWLIGDIPELHGIEVPRLLDSWERYRAQPSEATGPHITSRVQGCGCAGCSALPAIDNVAG